MSFEHRSFVRTSSACLSVPAAGLVAILKFFRCLTIGMFIAAACGAHLQAQTDAGSVAGRIADPSGAVIPGATISVTEKSTGAISQTTSNAAGDYSFPSLPVGRYDLTVQAPNFAPYKIANIPLAVSQQLTFNIQLEVGGTNQEVTVEASSVAVDTQSPAVQQVVEAQAVSQLPLNGRNPAALLFTVGGVSNPENASTVPDPSVLSGVANYPGETVASVHGSRTGSVYFSLDGGNNTDPLQVTGGPFPNPDATDQFAVQTANYGARYVSAPGGAVNIVTRSGTNEIHGSVFEFIRNGAVNARNAYSGGLPDVLKRNQFGAAVGAPIRKDKWFVFGSYQGTRQSNTTYSTIHLLTAAQRSGVFHSATPMLNPLTFQIFPWNPITQTTTIPSVFFSQVNQKILALLPVPTTADGSYTQSAPLKNNENQYVAKMDFSLGAHHVFLRYFGDVNDQPNIGNPSKELLGLPNAFHYQWQNGTAGDTWVKGPVVNDFRFTYLFSDVRSTAPPNAPTLAGLGANVTPSTDPTLSIQSASGDFTLGLANFATNPRHNMDFADNASITYSKHLVSEGFEVQNIYQAAYTTSAQNPLAIYVGISGDPRADFLVGAPTVFINGDGQTVALNGTLWGLHFEDVYKVTPRTTFTGGIRYDPYFPFTYQNNTLSCFNPGQQSKVYTNAPAGLIYPGDPGCTSSGTGDSIGYTRIQPRFGVAQQLDAQGRAVIHAAFGIYSQQVPLYALEAFEASSPFETTLQLTLPGQIDNPYARYPGGNPFANGYSLGTIPPANAAFPIYPQATSISSTFQPAAIMQYSLSAQYALTHTDLLEADYVGTHGEHEILNYSLNTPVYAPGASTQNEQARRPYPNLGAIYQIRSNGNSNYDGLTLTYRHSGKGLFVTSAFTYSHSLDDGTLPGNSLPGIGNAQPTLFHGYRYASSDYDQRLTWRNTAVWTTPALKGHNESMRLLLASWNLNAIFSMETGTPYSVTAGSDNSFTGLGADYADLVPSTSPGTCPSTYGPNNYPVGTLGGLCFAENAPGTFGTSSRNMLRGPGYTDLDAALQKSFPIHKETNFSLRIEAFNLANHVNRYAPNAAITNLPTFGFYGSAKDPRILQASGRFSF